MRTVYKYQLGVQDSPQTIRMPRDAKVVCVGSQGGGIVLWADVVPERHSFERLFVVYGTGHSVHPDAVYVGTTVIDPFVWHVFEVLP